jgi:hypothetical protein
MTPQSAKLAPAAKRALTGVWKRTTPSTKISTVFKCPKTWYVRGEDFPNTK